jgi:predicted ATPase/DNA-binding winged helix-turn-helix (wHTH) protein
MSTARQQFASPRRFGRFELRPAERVLLADGAPVALGSRAFDVLVAFVDRPGALVTKDELLATVWQGLVVEENNLQVQVSTLRKVLGPGALATIPGRGYRFNVPVTGEQATAAPAEPVVEPTDPRSAVGNARTNLPPRLPMLFGRAHDIDAVAQLLADHAVVTISGAGGIGKTRVAQAVARRLADDGRYPDGVWWIELAALSDRALVPSAIAQAMGIELPVNAHPPTTLRSLLAARHALLVLDNCEHLADDVALLVDALTGHAPLITVLVTSQETLRASDEHVYRLGGLAGDAGAVPLFEARAQAADPRFALTPGNLAAVTEICGRLDGIPLAIELAAARVPFLGVEGLRARLHERFHLLTGGARVVLRRHQTLRAMFEWSHGLLGADEQAVFRRLGVFAGGFTLEAAQHVASDERIDPWTALDHLGALVDKSLVLAEGAAVPRYRMLETTRAYAMERLAESGETEAALRRHAHAMLAVVEPLDAYENRWRASGNAQPAAAAELDNLRAALEWTDTHGEGALAVALAGVSYTVWGSSFHLAEGLARCLALRRYVDAQMPPEVAARYWLTIAQLGVYSTRRESYEAARRAAALYGTIGDDRRLFEALTFAAVQGTRFATVEAAQREIEAAAAVERAEWPARLRSRLMFARCFWFARQGEFKQALACAQRQVSICRDGGIELSALYAMSNLTFMEAMVGRPHDALEHARASVARLVELGADAGAGHLNHTELIALILLDRPREALAAARDAFPRLSHEGDQHRLLLPLALVNARLGRVEAAARILGFEAARQDETGENPSIIASLLQERLEPLLAALSTADRARLATQGAALREEQAFDLALHEGDDHARA